MPKIEIKALNREKSIIREMTYEDADRFAHRIMRRYRVGFAFVIEDGQEDASLTFNCTPYEISYLWRKYGIRRKNNA